MKKIVISFCFLTACLGFSKTQAQTVEDAVRISQYSMFGTASYVGRAGAIGALGADFTAASYNPAGLGVYSRSEFFFSPSINITSTQSTYYGSKASNFAARGAIDPIGAIFVAKLPSTSSWKAFQLGVGLNRLASYNSEVRIEGSANSSITDFWANEANDGYFSITSNELAIGTGLVDKDSSGSYRSFLQGSPVRQTKNFNQSGGNDELTFSFSGNYNDFLYIGATVGVPFISYNLSSLYTEQTYDDVGFDYGEELSTSGAGVNLKLGAIIRPIEQLRIGIGFHTPTIYWLEDAYNYTLKDYGANRTQYTDGYFNYTLATPYKLLGSIAASFGNQTTPVAGSIGVDYEMSDYSFMRYYANDYSSTAWETGENDAISKETQIAHTLRVGGTLNVQKMAIRLGYAFMSSPYKGDNKLEGNKNTVTAGIGYRSRSFFVDLAYAYTWSEREYDMYGQYLPAYVEAVQQKQNRSLIVSTFGFRF